MTLKYAQTVSSQVSQTGRSYTLKNKTNKKNRTKIIWDGELSKSKQSNCNLGSYFWAPKQTNNHLKQQPFPQSKTQKIVSLNNALVPWLSCIKGSQNKWSCSPPRGSTTLTPFPVLCTKESRWRPSRVLPHHFSAGSLCLIGLCQGWTSLSAAASNGR